MSELTNANPLHGEIALVTAATRGIGRACALALGRAGAHVAVGCRDEASGNEVAEEIRSYGARAMAVVMDMTEFASFPAAVEAVEQELGAISILVNNAGNSRPAPALDVMPDDYDAMFDLNVKGAFFASQAVARGMSARKRGCDRQHRVPGRRDRAAERIDLLHDQGVDDPHDAMPRRRMGGASDPRQCGGADLHPHGWHPALARGCGVQEVAAGTHPLGRVGEPGDVAAAVAFPGLVIGRDDHRHYLDDRWGLDGGLTGFLALPATAYNCGCQHRGIGPRARESVLCDLNGTTPGGNP